MSLKESKLHVSIKSDLLSLLSGNDQTLDENINISLAIYLYTGKHITLARAAELSGKSVSDFIEILTDHNIPWAEYTEEHRKQDNETIQYILEEEEKYD